MSNEEKFEAEQLRLKAWRIHQLDRICDAVASVATLRLDLSEDAAFAAGLALEQLEIAYAKHKKAPLPTPTYPY